MVFFLKQHRNLNLIRRGVASDILVAILILFFFSHYRGFSQDLYLEDFDLPEGTTVDNGATAWTRDISNANLGSEGFFETRIVAGQSVFQAVDTDGEAVWISQLIDISSFSTVVVSVDIAENGTLEGNDYIRLYYILNSGSETVFGNFTNDFGDTFQTVVSPVLSGSTVQVIIRVRNNETSEEHLIDNVKVFNGSSGSTTLYSRDSRQWNNQNAWSVLGFTGVSCHCTPNSNTNVTIGSSHAIRLDPLASVNSITIQDGARIYANSASHLLVGGNFTNTSSHTDPIGSNVQTLTLNGTDNQELNLNGESIFDLVVNKSSGAVTLTGELDLVHSLQIQTVTQFEANGNLKIISTSDGELGNGSIGELPTGASVTGAVTVQRYMSAEGNIWRYISSPVSNATIADWQDDFLITGNFDDPSTGPGIDPNTASLYYYGESGSGTNKQLGWTAYPTSGSAADNPIIPGTGYSALMLDGLNPVVIDVTGTINQGDFNYNVSFSGSGWNLLGNPYPATIDWKNTNGWNRSNLANAIYLRNNQNGNENSIVVSFVDGVGTNGGNGLVSTGQSFWVLAIGNNPSLVVNERAKSNSTGTFLRKNSPDNLFRVTLESAGQSDEIVVRFNHNATPGFDPEMDALKFPNGGVNLAAYVDRDQPMAINALPLIQDFTSVYLELSNTTHEDYSLHFTEMQKLNPAYSLTLIDHYLDSSLQIVDSTRYSFTINQTEPASHQDRFELMIALEVISANSGLSVPGILAHPNPVNGYLTIELPSTSFERYQVLVFNGQGEQVTALQTDELQQQLEVDFSIYPPGVYHVQVAGNRQKQHLRIINFP